MSLEKAVYVLIEETSTTLPKDVYSALARARDLEDEGSLGRKTLETILDNAKAASRKRVPLCQDTGLPVFFVKKPEGASESGIRSAVEAAVKKATKDGILRPNSVDAVSGANSGDNAGAGLPQTHFEDWSKDYIRVDLLLKGGGSENVGAQYSLPDETLGAERSLDGVRKCALDTVFRAQGMGCPPGFLAVVVGGDRASAHAEAKKLLLEKVGERNRNKALAALEEKILLQANKLGIGPSGLGGKTTLLDAKASALGRHPASFFVTAAYCCWALRRGGIDYKNEGIHDKTQTTLG